MSTRTTYTSTIIVPIYASWKCRKCGEINYSGGAIRFSKQESTSSFLSIRHKEAKARASELAHAEWAEYALKIMLNPNTNASAIRRDLSLHNTKCTKCRAKPNWDKDTRYEIWSGISLVPAIISGLVAFSTKTNITAWLLFIVFSGIIVYGIITGPKYKKMMADLPKQYTPAIGSLNPELINYARNLRKTIPTPDETIEIVKSSKVS